jgi:hypothetical protein
MRQRPPQNGFVLTGYPDLTRQGKVCRPTVPNLESSKSLTTYP